MINCIISSSKETNSYKDLRAVTFPACFGEMQILPGHAETFVELENGEIILTDKNQEKISLPISKGTVCHIKDDEITVIL